MCAPVLGTPVFQRLSWHGLNLVTVLDALVGGLELGLDNPHPTKLNNIAEEEEISRNNFAEEEENSRNTLTCSCLAISRGAGDLVWVLRVLSFLLTPLRERGELDGICSIVEGNGSTSLYCNSLAMISLKGMGNIISNFVICCALT